MLENVLVG